MKGAITIIQQLHGVSIKDSNSFPKELTAWVNLNKQTDVASLYGRPCIQICVAGVSMLDGSREYRGARMGIPLLHGTPRYIIYKRLTGLTASSRGLQPTDLQGPIYCSNSITMTTDWKLGVSLGAG